jgi:hypothetical protein
MKNKEESLQHFEEAYLIYESYFGPSALPTARAALQLASLLEEHPSRGGKLSEALRYASLATEAFRDIYGEESEHAVNA